MQTCMAQSDTAWCSSLFCLCVLPRSLAFLCVADEAYGRIMPAAYLDKLAADWTAEIGVKLEQQKEPVREGQLTATYS